MALCKIKTINYDRLDSEFDTKVDKKSCYRRMQRFMKELDFRARIVSGLIFNRCCQKHKYFNARGTYKNVAFPPMFKMLRKNGKSDMAERIEFIKQHIKCLGKKISTVCWQIVSLLEING